MDKSNKKTTNSVNLKKIREQYGFSQEYLADKLGISRVTLAKIEKGERNLKAFEKQKFDLLLQEFDLGEFTQKMENGELDSVRIDIPQENREKFRNVLLYILNRVGAKPNVGKTVLYKLLYFIDFNYYEKNREQLMGLTYIKAPYGPLPKDFDTEIASMELSEELLQVKSNFFQHDQKKYIPLKSLNEVQGNLSGKELQVIDEVLNKYSDKTATEISEISHRDTPWKVAKNGDVLKYEHAFYRTDEFSVGETEEL